MVPVRFTIFQAALVGAVVSAAVSYLFGQRTDRKKWSHDTRGKIYADFFAAAMAVSTRAVTILVPERGIDPTGDPENNFRTAWSALSGAFAQCCLIGSDETIAATMGTMLQMNVLLSLFEGRLKILPLNKNEVDALSAIGPAATFAFLKAARKELSLPASNTLDQITETTHKERARTEPDLAALYSRSIPTD